MPFPLKLSFEASPQICSTSYACSPFYVQTTSHFQPARLTSALRRNRRQERLIVSSSATAVKERPRPGEKKGFVEEMRMAAMKLHTRDQSPREGQRPESENPVQQWTPSRPGYLRFLAESKAVYDVLEQIVEDAPHPEYTRFRNTGLERSQRLAHDIAWLQETYDLAAPQMPDDAPGVEYAKALRQMAVDDPAVFICHYYNFYFAHTAGGKMIGRKVSDMILGGATLEFYKWEGDVKEKLEGVREQLNELAASWTREQKDRCLQETQASFRYSGDILRTIIAPAK